MNNIPEPGDLLEYVAPSGATKFWVDNDQTGTEIAFEAISDSFVTLREHEMFAFINLTLQRQPVKRGKYNDIIVVRVLHPSHGFLLVVFCMEDHWKANFGEQPATFTRPLSTVLVNVSQHQRNQSP